uniref:G-protein coupled receptors family 3 profile domain-containing protein n=1 Tax=Esox lucius TaxID=8010 RepID=A0A3P8YQ81_ESOLU
MKSSGFLCGIVLCLELLYLVPAEPQPEPLQCSLIAGASALPVLQRTGDVKLGGLFSLHDMVLEADLSFTSKPVSTHCSRFNLRTYRWMQTMLFAIDEINRNDHLLPNITLGYKIYDSCSASFHALRASMELMGGVEEGWERSCRGMVPVVIGDGSSTLSVAVARFLGVFHVPQVSYFSSSSSLSNKAEFPSFLRTIPSDMFQVNALVQLIQHFGWTWVGVVVGDDTYLLEGAQIFSEEVQKVSVCMALHEIIPRNHTAGAMASIVARIRSSGSRVVLVFALEHDTVALFDEVLQQGLIGVQWLTSEAWTTAFVLSTPSRFLPILQGSLGFAIRRLVHLPGLQEFLLHLNPLNPDTPKDPFLPIFWEEVFGCSLQGAQGGSVPGFKPLCTGSEKLENVRNIFSDVSQLRVTYNVYKAVYAVAHALQAIKNCEKGRGTFPLQNCPDTDSLQPWQLLQYLKHVEFFNLYGDEIKFDKNGDPAAVYDLLNWQLGANGQVEFVTVGTYDESLGTKKLHIQEEDIIWNRNQTTIPVSVCSNSCPPGTRKAHRPHFPVCCFDCVVYATECVRCLPEFWSNEGRTACNHKEVDFLSYGDIMGITLLTVALLGSLCTATVILIFACHCATPIVRANNSELSFLLLFSLALCFLCSLTFIGRPSEWSCMLRHTAFGITFVLCISCVLGKTLVVLMAFRATLPGTNSIKWFRPPQQRAIITLCTLAQVVICSVWLAVAPPTPRRLTTHESDLAILVCDEGSALCFSLVLGYIGLLASLCLLLAFLARKLPDNFNEARLITCSMLIFCAVWVAFVPAYISSPGKYSTATEVFAILASSYGLLACLFLPKCYIILLRPEKNTRTHLMAKSVPDNS